MRMARGGALALARWARALLFVGVVVGFPASTEAAAQAPTPRASPAPAQYQNPTVPFDCPDPGVLGAADGHFYMVCTGGSFPIRRSDDLVHWSDTGAAILPAGKPPWAANGGRNWAPEIHAVNGGYVAYFTSVDGSNRLCVGAASAPAPAGPYTTTAGPLVQDALGVIDPTYFRDDDGRQWLFFKIDGNSQGQPTPIYARQLSDDGLSFAAGSSSVEVLRNDPGTWEGGVVEAPFVAKHNGEYYLFYSGNVYDYRYRTGVARASSITGPYQKHGAPILANNSRWVGPGHGSVVTAGGREWFAYHAWAANADGTNNGALGREGMLDPIAWGSDGWPSIGNGTPGTGPTTGPGPGSTSGSEEEWPLRIHRSPADLDGDGKADVCARDSDGITCSLSTGAGFAKAFSGPAFSDANGWSDLRYRSTIQFGDLDGDGKADVCARAIAGIVCNLSTGTGFGPNVTGPKWSDANGWSQPQYNRTIQLADVDGDGKADLCARAAAGIVCEPGQASGFGPEITGPAWSDASGWADVKYYSTIDFVDVNGDGKADVCARDSDGIVCELSDGHGFPTEIHGPAFSDASGWGAVQYGSTIRFVDVNGDGKADVCARDANGIVCDLSDGRGFPTELRGPAWSDANGWALAEYFSTIQFADLNGDRKADVCARASDGMHCALSDGAGFPTEILGPAWSDANGWNRPQYGRTIAATDVNGDGKDDLCARDSQGITCALFTGTGFAPAFAGPAWSDGAGWAYAAYYPTIRFVGGPSRLVPPPDGGVAGGGVTPGVDGGAGAGDGGAGGPGTMPGATAGGCSLSPSSSALGGWLLLLLAALLALARRREQR